MNLVLFTHPPFLNLRSQGHYAAMLSAAFRARGHHVELRHPEAAVRRLVGQGRLAKWAGYADQYLLFPPQMRRALAQDPPDTLYVFCDQALGPWVPLAAGRPHVVHCHDLLALRSALGEWPDHPTSITGRIYQHYIRRGFARARHFISISRKTRDDLHRLGRVHPLTSEVVYNGLNHDFQPLPPCTAREVLDRAGIALPAGPFVLHVGGGQWYKNTAGVVALYTGYVQAALGARLPVAPLVLVGPPPTGDAAHRLAHLEPPARWQRLQGVRPEVLQALYSLAGAFVFPSLAEGFGWPIVEAMACGCPVLTTGEAPMSEVGGEAACYLPRLCGPADLQTWAESGAHALFNLLDEAPVQRAERVQAGRAQARRFRAELAIDRYLEVYEQVLRLERGPAP